MQRSAVDATENDGIVFLDEIDKIARATAARAPASPAKACSATCCRWSKARRSRPNTGRSRPTTSCSSPRAPSMSPSRPTSCRNCRAACRSASSSGRWRRTISVRILTETEASLIKQYIALMKTEGVTLDFTDDAIDRARRHRRRPQCERREYRRAPAADGDGAGARRDLLRRARPQRPASPSTPPM